MDIPGDLPAVDLPGGRARGRVYSCRGYCEHNLCSCSWAEDKSAKGAYAGMSATTDKAADASPSACERNITAADRAVR